ncbi:CRISPR-associated protein Cas5 [Listeria monocytogenes]|nr:CRISPR-associated protein Cas5 [Listeria monocytogenes]
MMKAIKMNVFLETANFRMPISFQQKESYPLPPFSTVIGMVHVACGFTSYHPMNISVTGNSFSTVHDIATRYEFHPSVQYDKARHQLSVYSPEKEKIIGITRGVSTAHLLTDLHLQLHIIPEDQSEIFFIEEQLRSPKQFLSLGRHEDIMHIEKVQVVDIQQETLSREVELSMASYIPTSYKIGRTLFRMSKNYEIVEIKKKFYRKFVKHEVFYVGKSTVIPQNTHVWVDSDRDILFPV